MSDSYTTTINGIEVTITRANDEKKKLTATFVHPQTKRKNTISYGASKYKHYNDVTNLLSPELNHNDPKRRALWKARHQVDEIPEDSLPTAKLLAWKTLW